MKYFKIIFNVVSFVLFAFFLTACQSGSKVKSPLSETLVQCKDPRPQACTKEYQPVCASKDTGVRCIKSPCPSEEDVSYGNACTACADPKVHGYVPGGACN